MDAILTSEIREILTDLASRLGLRTIALCCDHENLETVYLKIDDEQQLLVTDDCRTFQYLTASEDDTFVGVEQIDLAAVTSACRDCGVTFVPASGEWLPEIACRPTENEPVTKAIDRVAAAVDAVFEIARKNQ